MHISLEQQGSLLLTDTSGVIVYADDAVARRTGYSIAQMVGKWPGDLWGGHMTSSFYKMLWRTVRDKKESFSGTVVNNYKSGAQSVCLHVSPVLDAQNTPKYFAEIQPSREYGYSEFRQEFSEEKLYAKNLFAWLGKKDFKNAEQLIDILETNYIAPLQDVFLARNTDKQLIQAAQQEPEQFAVLYKKYQPLVLNYFAKRLAKIEDADELTHDTFVKCFSHLPKFEIKNASYKTYILRVAHNILVNYYRKRRPISLEHLPGDGPLHMPELDMLFLKWLLKRELGKLSLIEQTCLKLKYFEGYSCKEIAAKVGKSENAIKLHLSRARKKLRLYLSK